MKVLILGASGFLGGTLYKKMKEETDFWVLGTYFESKKDKELIKLNVTNLIEVKTFLEHFNPEIIVWCLLGKTNEKELIEKGLSNVLNTINQTCKFIFMSINAGFSEADISSCKVNELLETIIKLIKSDYKGIVHLGPEIILDTSLNGPLVQ
ncbi:MAG: NAD-dependent epimerase/dehydratase family protein [Clostridiaceae bacterium]|nr:NAD-dependent epimerase/dehydratase family protein [Clostridiaceae bacterium]